MVSQLEVETIGHAEALLCFQEVVQAQLVDLQTGLGDEWDHIGVGRDDGKTGGEYSPIFYQPKIWGIEEYRTYWLSQTPDVVGSVGWDAALPRIVTVARLRHMDSNSSLVHMCTHFDHQGQRAREESAALLVNIAKEWEQPAGSDTKIPVFLSGDFNVPRTNAAYRSLVSGGAMLDTEDIAIEARRFGGPNTFTGFTTSPSDDSHIDYVFVRPATNLAVLAHRILTIAPRTAPLFQIVVPFRSMLNGRWHNESKLAFMGSEAYKRISDFPCATYQE